MEPKDGLNISANGTKRWWLNGQLHRTDGPAEEWASGNKFWYLNGLSHRTDGPAAEYVSGTKYWYLNGQKLTEAEFNRIMLWKKINEL